jgi:hypothetical protein
MTRRYVPVERPNKMARSLGGKERPPLADLCVRSHPNWQAALVAIIQECSARVLAAYGQR